MKAWGLIPETGIVADTVLTVGFYLLALLFLAGWMTRRFTLSAATAGDDLDRGSYENYYTAQTDEYTQEYSEKPVTNRRRFGDGIRR